jgi:ATP-dependent RNA helicase DDX54/DBP10
LAARGIDIPLLENVIHYDFPPTMKLFIHRSGRTARAGQKGTSYSLVSNDEVAYIHDLSAYVGKKYYDTV